MRPLPVFAAVRTAEGFAVVGEIFNEQEIILIEVQVESAGVVADKWGRDLGHVFSFFMIFAMCLGWHEAVNLNIHFVQLFNFFHIL